MTYLNVTKILPLLVLASLFSTTAMAASEAGQVVSLTGTLTAKSAQGAIRTMAVKDMVSAGETLYTGRDSFARLKFTDGGEIDLRPNTHFEVASYNFEADHPEKDGAGFALLKGSLRARTGQISKRGDKSSYRMQTSEAIIGVRGTEYGLQVCRSDCEDIKTEDGKPPRPGLHSQVDHGGIVVRNKAGEVDVDEGDFGFVSDQNSPPEKVSRQQGVRIEMPPAVLKDWERRASNPNGSECATK